MKPIDPESEMQERHSLTATLVMRFFLFVFAVQDAWDWMKFRWNRRSRF